ERPQAQLPREPDRPREPVDTAEARRERQGGAVPRRHRGEAPPAVADPVPQALARAQMEEELLLSGRGAVLVEAPSRLRGEAEGAGATCRARRAGGELGPQEVAREDQR